MDGQVAGWQGIPIDRVVAVVARLANGLEQVGSGYLVGGWRVLTAEHCTRDKKTGQPPVRCGWCERRTVFRWMPRCGRPPERQTWPC